MTLPRTTSRRGFLRGISLALFAAPLATPTKAGNVPRVGVLLPGGGTRAVEALRQGLRELG